MSCCIIATNSNLGVFISCFRMICTTICRINHVVLTNSNTAHSFCIIRLTNCNRICHTGYICRADSNRVLTICIIAIACSKRSSTRSICIYAHSSGLLASCTRIITNYCRVFTSLFRCCFPSTFIIVNVVIGTYSNSRFSICITYITYSNRSITRSVITSTNSRSRATCSFIFITYCCRSVICRCIFSTDCYFTIMASYIISSILITYNDGVLTNIIVLTITFWTSFSPDVYMAIISINTSLCF